jgi:hypothetical protein
MKIRNGFVSNSSSSSFVVAFDKTPLNVDEMRKLLFGEDRSHRNEWDDSEGFSTWELAERVFDDMREGGPLKLPAIAEELEGYVIYETLPGAPRPPKSPDWGGDWNSPETRQKWADYDDAKKKHGEELAKLFRKRNPNAEIYKFHYGDDDGSFFSCLEHGGTFDALPHVRISHH